jgi:tetratricopeptide (TPR) repeat protein
MLLPGGLQAHPGASSTIEHFSHQIEHKPDDQALYIKRGIAYSSDGQYEQALGDFRRAESLGDPLLVSFDLGVLYYRKGEFKTSLDYLNAFLQRFPDHSPALEYRARVQRDRGDFSSSIDDFKRVFELQKRPNPGHYISVANMLSTEGATGIQQALAVLDAGNLKLGLTPQLQNRAIELERERGRLDLAIERMQALRSMLGDSADWKVAMAELYYQNAQVEPADAMLEAAETQLTSLRRTPARIALQQRITQLRAAKQN